jgi:hypothetical protein
MKEIAESLSTSLGQTVYYGFIPDAPDGSLDAVIGIRDFPAGRLEHVFGQPLPAITPFGISVHARATTQDAARDACQAAWEALTSMGYTALTPPVSLGKQDGRFEAVAEVEAHTIR